MKISIIIPAHNEEASISNAIESVLRQSYKNFEIIVVNDGSTDKTAEIALRYGVRIIPFKTGHSAAFARNAGAREASGNALLFLDADVVLVSEDFLERLAADLKNYHAVTFPFRPSEPKTFISRCLYTKWKMHGAFPKEKTVINANSPIRRLPGAYLTETFRQLGGFNESIFYYEDTDLGNRFYESGGKALFDPNLWEIHEEPSTLGEFLRQARWAGKGIYAMFKKGKFYGKGMLFWLLYLLTIPLLLVSITPFITANLAVLLYAIWLSMKSGDLIGSIGFAYLWGLRSLVAFYQFSALLLSGA